MIAAVAVPVGNHCGYCDADKDARLAVLYHLEQQGAFGKIDPAALHLAMETGDGAKPRGQRLCTVGIDIDPCQGHHAAPDAA